MTTDGVRAAVYMRVSTTDGQTTENQRMALARVAAHRRWKIVQTYEDTGISGAKGRDQRPAFNQMLKDAVRRRFDVLMVWSIDRLGRSVLHVASAMAEMDAAGVALYSDQQAIDRYQPLREGHDADGLRVRGTGTGDDPGAGPGRFEPGAGAGAKEAGTAIGWQKKSRRPSASSLAPAMAC